MLYIPPSGGKSAIFIYDGYPGGVGLAQRGYEVIQDLLEKTLDHVSNCECEEGCPSCIHSPKCGSGNKPLDKKAAIVVLEFLLGHISLENFYDESQETEPEPVIEDKEMPETEPNKPRIVYFDLETQKLAQEVGGWKNTHLMRISVAVIYDSLEEQFLSFTEDKIPDLLSHLEKADLIVGFNNKKFDNRVLGAYTDKKLNQLPTFDILEDVYQRLGFRLGLDHLAQETINKGKSADGLKAVEWFRQGEIKKLTDYCQQDVAATRDLFLFGLENGHLIYRTKKENRRVRLTVDWKLEDLIS